MLYNFYDEFPCKYYGHEEDYPHYDNENIIEVSRIKKVPNDYYGLIGVPITVFYNTHLLQMFKVISSKRDAKINGESIYMRIIIQRRTDSEIINYLKRKRVIYI